MSLVGIKDCTHGDIRIVLKEREDLSFVAYRFCLSLGLDLFQNIFVFVP